MQFERNEVRGGQTGWSPRDPLYRERILDSFGRQGFMQHLGAEIGSLEPGLCVIILNFRQAVAQQHGFFHGGVVGALADNAAAYAAFTLLASNQSALTVEYKVSLVAPSEGDRLKVVGQVVRAGRALTTCRSDIYACTKYRESLSATALITMMTLGSRGDGSPIGLQE